MTRQPLIFLLIVLAIVVPAAATTYTSHYPAGYSQTYVNATRWSDSSLVPWYCTNPSLSLTGHDYDNSWRTGDPYSTSQTLHEDLGTAYQIKRIYYENSHDSGLYTYAGVQHFTLWGSNTSGSFTTIAYATDTGWTQLSTDVAVMNQHADADVADPQYVYVTTPGTWSYRYYRLKIADGYGGNDGVGLRRFELQTADAGGAAYTDPYAGAVASSVQGAVPLSVDFSDYSVSNVTNPTAWNWTYQNVTGDNIERSFATTKTPTFVFNYGGSYSIRLNASSSTEYNKSPANVVWVNTTSGGNNPPTPAFSANPLNPIADHVPVTFTDASTGSPTNWSWTINNGIYYLTYYSQNPVISDMTQGSWTVSLTVSNAYGSNTLTKNNYITVGAPTPTPTPTPTPIPTATPTPAQTQAPGPYMPSALLLHLNSATWVDDAMNPHPLTAGGSPTLNTTTKKFGAGAIQFNNNQYLKVTTSTPADFDVSTGDFTVDLWYYDTTGNTVNKFQALYDQAYSASHPPLVIVQNANDDTIVAYFSVGGLVSTWAMDMGEAPRNTWTHIAVVRKGNNYYTFNNGGLIETQAHADNIGSTAADPSIGGRSIYDQFFTGIIDEVRFSKTARWTSNFTVPQGESQDVWNYTSPGTYTWTCPIGVTSISARIAAAGGAGASGTSAGQYAGNGGSAGATGSYNNIVVSPGQTYTIVVGLAGVGQQNNTMALNTRAPSGGSSSAFGRIRIGGIGGNQFQVFTSTAGGDGQSTNFLTLSKLSQSGALLSGGNGQYGGTGGYGWGAGGGGGGWYTGIGGQTPATSSGAGANGTVLLSIPGAFGENTPDFSADNVAGTPGMTVHFTDLSVIRDYGGVSYLWDFGDGSPTSTQMGNVTHVYAFSGAYTVTLTLTSTILGQPVSMTEQKDSYIIVSNPQGTNTKLTYPPKDIRFHVQTIWGAPVNAVVSAVADQTTLGNYSYVAGLFGYTLDSVPLDTLILNGSTDSRGDITFAMMSNVQYAINATATGYTFTPFTMTPHDDNYIILANTNGNPFVQNGSSPSANAVFSVATTRYNQTAALLTVNYTDTAGATTAGTIYLTKSSSIITNATNATITLTSTAFTGANTTQQYVLFDGATAVCPSTSSAILTVGGAAVACTNQTLVDAQSYTASVAAATPGGNVTLSRATFFQEIKQVMFGLPASFLMYFAFGVIMVTALFATASTAPAMSVIVCFEGWIFYGLNAFTSIDANTPVGSLVAGVLTLMTFAAILFNFVSYRRQNK